VKENTVSQRVQQSSLHLETGKEHEELSMTELHIAVGLQTISALFKLLINE
jgi:hypothetical protein